MVVDYASINKSIVTNNKKLFNLAKLEKYI